MGHVALEPVQVNSSDYIAEIEQWRRQREAELRADDSWLSLAGLFVLMEGRGDLARHYRPASADRRRAGTPGGTPGQRRPPPPANVLGVRIAAGERYTHVN
jgi:hypothetical protein